MKQKERREGRNKMRCNDEAVEREERSSPDGHEMEIDGRR